MTNRPSPKMSSTTRVLVALGSNLGDRAGNIRAALSHLSAASTLLATSFLYSSPPMYLTAQPSFLNAVASLSTTLSPHQLLTSLKGIEEALGRAAGPRNGPRTLDLDILTYGDLEMKDATLEIPHPRILERPFVLKPVVDVEPAAMVGGLSAREMLGRIGEGGLHRVTPLSRAGSVVSWGGKPVMMGIINATPDSFSDGGDVESVEAAVRKAGEFVERGFDVLDVGGVSTRPGAGEVREQVEMGRVVPVIAALRKEFPHVGISIDTYRPGVAGEAVDAGADWVNDVQAGRGGGGGMSDVVSEKGCGWVMMHMRGTPENMMTGANIVYDGGLVEESAGELRARVEAASAAGLPRWDLMVDPGVGFAKTAEQSVEITRKLGQWRERVGGYPCLFGMSRKSSLTSLVPRLEGRDAKERDFATAGAIVAAINCGADILRVHNPALADTVTVAYEIQQKALHGKG